MGLLIPGYYELNDEVKYKPLFLLLKSELGVTFEEEYVGSPHKKFRDLIGNSPVYSVPTNTYTEHCQNMALYGGNPLPLYDLPFGTRVYHNKNLTGNSWAIRENGGIVFYDQSGTQVLLLNSIVYDGFGLDNFGIYIDEDTKDIGLFSIWIKEPLTEQPDVAYACSIKKTYITGGDGVNASPSGTAGLEALREWIGDLPTADPNAPGGDSTTGGGTGDFDGSSDLIPVPGLPGISAVDTGFVTLYNPSLAQLKSLSSYMWSNDFFDQIIKLFGDPMDAILSLSIVPVAVPDGGVQEVKVGNVSTGVTMTKAAAQYISIDCGSLNMREFWGSALDYAPNTKIQLYLPYIGYKFIDTDEVMNKTLGITYHVDILTGSCVAFVHSNGSVLYQFEGNCACNLPVTGKSWANIISAAINVAGTAAVLAGTGSIGAATLASGLVNTAGNVMGAKAIIEHGGTSSGSGGQMSVQSPYLIVERPRQSLAKGYNTFEGYPSNITAQLGLLTGYTAVESVHLEGINATDAELSEIESLLKGGVIL